MTGFPSPAPNERPVVFADRIGQWFQSWNKLQKGLGQYFTPVNVADFMAHLVIPPRSGIVRVLDPGAGTGILSCALCEVLIGDVDLEAYEADTNLADCLETCLHYTQQWMQTRGRQLRFKVIREDFVMLRSGALLSSVADSFDVAISNPPYFKISKSDPRAQAAAAVVYGQPNIYAIFMAISAALLKPNGQLVFITPRSFTAGSYFSRFRQYFFARMRPRAIHLFDSRRDVFNEVLQESIILLAERSSQDGPVSISSSAGKQDFRTVEKRALPLSEVLDTNNVLHVLLNNQHDEVAEIVRSWTNRLWDYDMEVSTGPVVPFRTTQLVASSGKVPATHVPLLWMQNVKPMQITWPLSRKSQYIMLDGAEKLLLPNRNYVLLRRFSAKEERRRLTAAPYLAELDGPFLGLENHLNYIHRPNGTLSTDETKGLAALLNSHLLDTYFRISNGNTQVSATELRAMPLPSLDIIVKIGQRVSEKTEIDTLITQVLGTYA
jgi:adenine-specific DNA-methyltransferase